MKRLEITGQKFNKLTAVKFDHVRSGKLSMWEFLCECGNLTIASAGQVKAGGTKSCGCLLHRTHLGYNSLPDGEASFRGLFYDYKYSAKERNIPFKLSEEFFRKITKKNCTYCGSEPLQKSASSNARVLYVYNGIDRVDSELGYTYNNVVPCCKVCNYAKHKMTTEQFMNWIARLVKFHNPECPAVVQGNE